MSRWLRLPAALLASALVAGAQPASAGRPEIVDLTCSRIGGGVAVDFRVADAWTAEQLDRLHSGLPVGFHHRIELRRPRFMGLWPAKVLARRAIDIEVVYDALTRRYTIERTTELLRGDRTSEPVEPAVEIVDTMDEVRRRTTAISAGDLRPSGDAADDPRVRVRVESSLGRRYLLLMIPTTVDVSATCEPGAP